MRKVVLVTLAIGTLGATTIVALAADQLAFSSQIEARQSFMNVYKFNLGLLGAMAREKAPYDARAASAAADNLLAASRMKNGAMWPAGSDMSADGYEGVTWAKPEIWSNYAEVREKGEALTNALEAMAAAAGDGLEGVRGNMSSVGNACKDCHKSFRADKD